MRKAGTKLLGDVRDRRENDGEVGRKVLKMASGLIFFLSKYGNLTLSLSASNRSKDIIYMDMKEICLNPSASILLPLL